MQNILDELKPVPGSCDYLVASGPRALVGKNASDDGQFELAVFVGRSRAGVSLRAVQDNTGAFIISILGDKLGLQPIDLSLFLRACIRRSSESSCSLCWPAELALDLGDPLNARLERSGDRECLEAGYADLRPAKQSSVSEVYRYPLDVPWLYDPLDYEVMIPILSRPGIHRILDLGCGSGRNAVPLENAGYEVHGIDSAPESIALCRHFVRAPEHFHEASAASIPFPDAYFDAVLDVGCLHMLSDSASRSSVLAETARVLKPGGKLCGRALTPRGPDWLAAQPFRSEATGFQPEDIVKEATPYFKPRILGQTAYFTYYQLLKVA